MNSDFFHKKQIIFPGIILRIFTALFDFTFVSILFSPIMQILTLQLFQHHFADFIATHNITIKTAEDIKLVITHNAFGDFLTSTNYWIYFLEVAMIQFTVFSIYFIVCWWKFGTTIIKYIFKVRIIDYKTQTKPTLVNSILRYFSYIFFIISIFMIIFRKDKRALHDLIADTIVIKS